MTSPHDPELPGSDLIARIDSAPADYVALWSSQSQLTFGALSAASKQNARRLQLWGVSPNTHVGIFLDRSFASVIATLAVWRTGGAFVPLDPGWPADRLAYVLGDCGAPVVISDRRLSARLSGSARILLLDDDAAEIAEVPPLRSAGIRSDQLAYIIYTSGSTGLPKGAEITHGNLRQLIDWHIASFGLSRKDRVSHLAGLGFDAAIWEVWPALAAEASITLADETVRTSPALLQAWLIQQNVTVAFVPTPLAEPMLAMPWPEKVALRFLLTGGDTLHSAPPPGLSFTVVNNYGPAECAVVATSGIVAPGSAKPSIGRPIAGATIMILDEAGQEVAPGQVGEICIGGGGVGRGYRNQPGLTASQFRIGSQGLRYYRTGDNGTILPDGQIAFLGRNDRQEKIRGQRIELDEIVCVLNRHPSVAASAVVARGTGDDKHLVAYIVPRESAMPAKRVLQEFAASALPAAMIPTVLVHIPALPLTANGKLSQDALPAPTDYNTLPDAKSRPATGPVEEMLLATVRTLLQTEAVGVEDHFFLVGGHSLLGTQLIVRARAAFGVELSLRDLFEAETVVGLAAKIEALLLAEIEAMSEDEVKRQVRAAWPPLPQF